MARSTPAPQAARRQGVLGRLDAAAEAAREAIAAARQAVEHLESIGAAPIHVDTRSLAAGTIWLTVSPMDWQRVLMDTPRREVVALGHSPTGGPAVTCTVAAHQGRVHLYIGARFTEADLDQAAWESLRRRAWVASMSGGSPDEAPF